MGGIRGRVGRSQVDPAVRPIHVVVGDVFAEGPFEMRPTEDERPVKAFTSEGADPSFGERVRFRSADRGGMASMPAAAKTASKLLVSLESRP